MENQIHYRLKLVLTLALALASLNVQARARKERADSLVRLMKAESIEQMVLHGQQYRKAVASTFLHNGTYLISDTALWNVDTKVINAYGHVKVIQDETILTSDKLDYFIDDRNIGGLPDWGTIYRMISRRKTWHDIIVEEVQSATLTSYEETHPKKKPWWRF